LGGRIHGPSPPQTLGGPSPSPPKYPPVTGRPCLHTYTKKRVEFQILKRFHSFNSLVLGLHAFALERVVSCSQTDLSADSLGFAGRNNWSQNSELHFSTVICLAISPSFYRNGCLARNENLKLISAGNLHGLIMVHFMFKWRSKSSCLRSLCCGMVNKGDIQVKV